MLLVSEAESAALATHEMAYAAVKEALIAVRHEGCQDLSRGARAWLRSCQPLAG